MPPTSLSPAHAVALERNAANFVSRIGRAPFSVTTFPDAHGPWLDASAWAGGIHYTQSFHHDGTATPADFHAAISTAQSALP